MNVFRNWFRMRVHCIWLVVSVRLPSKTLVFGSSCCSRRWWMSNGQWQNECLVWLEHKSKRFGRAQDQVKGRTSTNSNRQKKRRRMKNRVGCGDLNGQGIEMRTNKQQQKSDSWAHFECDSCVKAHPNTASDDQGQCQRCQAGPVARSERAEDARRGGQRNRHFNVERQREVRIMMCRRQRWRRHGWFGGQRPWLVVRPFDVWIRRGGQKQASRHCIGQESEQERETNNLIISESANCQA